MTTKRGSRQHHWLAQIASFLVVLQGLWFLALALLELARNHLHGTYNGRLDVYLLIGLGLIYLASLLGRRKRNAWQAALVIYGLLLSLNLLEVLLLPIHHRVGDEFSLHNLLISLLVTASLVIARHEYTVRSDIAAFKNSLTTTILVMLIAFAYGVGGYMLMDKTDFHREITPLNAAANTLDQFALVIPDPLTPQTRRAYAFVDSLSVISLAAVVYSVFSFFQPIRGRLTTHTRDRAAFWQLLRAYPSTSEDFFKLWPHDKQYYFAPDGRAALAYRVQHGVALVQGDPVGDLPAVRRLIAQFVDVCRSNDWTPAFIHVDKTYASTYKRLGFNLQSLGQEAMLDLHHFQTDVSNNKYFRNIKNRFNKAGYTAKLLVPPHSQATLEALRSVSDDWLQRPGRAERGFVMGYFTDAYMQQCQIWACYDQAGQLQGFINLVPANDFDSQEATYDLLRQRGQSLSNSNDFLLTTLIDHLQQSGFKRLNLGLSPLAGITGTKADSLVDSVLMFAYNNGDRFYSFSGLHRFKNKYEPTWSDRYLVYPGSLSKFSKVMNALLAAMRKSVKLD